MIPDYLFGPKLERMFSDGLKLFAWSSLFTKQTYLDNKKPGPGHSSQILNYLKKNFRPEFSELSNSYAWFEKENKPRMSEQWTVFSLINKCHWKYVIKASAYDKPSTTEF